VQMPKLNFGRLLMTAFVTLAIVAAAYRIPQIKKLVFGDN